MTYRSTRPDHTFTQRLIALACAVLVIGGSAVTAQTRDGVTVVSSDVSSFVVRVTPSVSTRRLAGGEILPEIPGARVSNPAKVGEPMEMSIEIPIALPSRSGSSVEVISAEYDAPVAGRIAPVPATRPDGEGFNIPVYTVNAAAYARGAAPVPTAQLTYLGVARDVHAGVIQVAPYQFNRSASTIRFLRSVTVRLRYGGTDPAIASGVSEGLGIVSRLS
ncbi:MAG: C25 family peptidase propeptide domain-containing protein, partial [Bacteroidota bacterium]